MSEKKSHFKLGELFSTAICGNDILSSTLYVSGIAALYAGVWAPAVLLCVALILQLFRGVYTEVVEALPINGGAYNALLNGSSKSLAAVAGVMTVLSYVATAVISAKIGVEYLFQAFEGLGFNIDFSVYVIPGTVVLLGIFALLVYSGIKDSAKVALVIFVTHIITLILFIFFGLLRISDIGLTVFIENLKTTQEVISSHGGLAITLFLAFSASLLGVSGFESSANFVEEQEKGVFRKTLRNMAFGVLVFNPLIALIIVGTINYPSIVEAKDFLLAVAASDLGGVMLQILDGFDAFFVLSGAVLTAYVGVSGLVSRMASDNCFPDFVAYENKNKSYPVIIFSFLFICASILFATKGKLLSLAGVYTISFLGVMTLFAIGNILLKETRTELKRTYYASVPIVILAGIATSLGLYGNIVIDDRNVTFFGTYFVPAFLIVIGMIYQETVARHIIHFSRKHGILIGFVEKYFERLANGHYIVFLRNPKNIHTALEYLTRNENGHNVTFVYCSTRKNDKKLSIIKNTIPMLQGAGVYPYFKIKVVGIKREFTPEVIDYVAKKFKVPHNKILIGSIHSHHDFDYTDLNGVRIIFG